MNIVTVQDKQVVTDSLIISSGSKVQHRAILQLIKNYAKYLGLFGRVAFEMRTFEIYYHGFGDHQNG